MSKEMFLCTFPIARQHLSMCPGTLVPAKSKTPLVACSQRRGKQAAFFVAGILDHLWTNPGTREPGHVLGCWLAIGNVPNDLTVLARWDLGFAPQFLAGRRMEYTSLSPLISLLDHPWANTWNERTRARAGMRSCYRKCALNACLGQKVGPRSPNFRFLNRNHKL